MQDCVKSPTGAHTLMSAMQAKGSTSPTSTFAAHAQEETHIAENHDGHGASIPFGKNVHVVDAGEDAHRAHGAGQKFPDSVYKQVCVR